MRLFMRSTHSSPKVSSTLVAAMTLGQGRPRMKWKTLPSAMQRTPSASSDWENTKSMGA